MMANNNLYPKVEYSEASEEVKEVYDDTMRTLQLPFVLNWFKHQGNHPHLLKANWYKLKHTLMDGEVPNVLKQLIIHNISKERGCDYCAKAHGIFANSMASSISEKIDFKLSENLTHDLLPETYKTALKVVTQIALKPESTSTDHFEALRNAGFTPSEIAELLAQADLTNMLNTIAYITGTRLDNELIEAQA